MENEAIIYYLAIWSLFIGVTLPTAPNIDYSHNMRVLMLPKNTKPGSLIYRLKGSHPDSIPLTFGVKGTLGRKLLDIKPADFRSADVYLRSQLEEEVYNLTIFVTDGNQTTEVDSRINVTNPEGPLISPFIDVQPIYFVNENSPHNSTIGFVMAKDKQSSNLPVMFELRGSDNFAIRYIFGPKGSSKAVILLVKDVDYERRNIYPMTIIVTNAWTNETIDTRNIASVDVLIVVRDAEDTPPNFVNLPSVVQISEDTESGSILDTITAEDGDVEINRKIVYSLIKNPFSNYFSINKTSGELNLKVSGIELKNIVGLNNPFILSINATEVVPEEEMEIGLAVSSKASIAFVIVANQNRPPVFATNVLKGYIEENSPVMTAIRWFNYSLPRVNDSDSGLNGTMDLMLHGFQDENVVHDQTQDHSISNMFIIQPIWGLKEITFSILLGSPISLDYEKGPNQIKLKITATDRSPFKPLSAEAIVSIDVIDVNDNYPQFKQSMYNVSLYENAPIGTKLIQVEAIDPDSGIFGQVKYTSINGPIAKNFILDRDNGMVTLRSIDGIDREKISEYTLTVEARDENGFGLSNVTQIHVTILDANDNEPEFVQSRYDAVLNPDGLTFTQPLTVKAVDADEAGTINSQVIYEIIDGNYQGKFSINNITGSITITSPLTFNDNNRQSRLLSDEFTQSQPFPSIVLKIRAHDQGLPYRFSTVEVFIHHKDFLNRTVSFILPRDDSQVRNKRDDIERGLTRLAGADVHIYSVKSISLGPRASQIDAWIAYPIHTIIDLRDFVSIFTDLTGSQPSIPEKDLVNRESNIQTAAIYRNDYELVLWILLFLIVITLLFLIVLLAVWCTFYRNDRKTKTILETIEPTKRIILTDKSTNYTEKNGSHLHTSKLQKHSDHETIVNEAYRMQDEHRTRDSSKSRGDETSSSDTRKRGSRDSNNEKQSKFKRIKLGRHRRVRVSPEIVGEAEPIYLEDFTDDPEYYIVRRPKVRKPLPRHDDSERIQNGYNDSESAYTNNNYHDVLSHRGDSNTGRVDQTLGTEIHRGGSLREKRLFPDHLVNNFRSVSEAEIRDIKLEDIEDVNVTTEVKQSPRKNSHSDDEYIPRRSAQSVIPPRIEVLSPQSSSTDHIPNLSNGKLSNQSRNKESTKNEISRTEIGSSISGSSSSASTGSTSSSDSELNRGKIESKSRDPSIKSMERKVFDRSSSEGSHLDMGLIDGVVTRSGQNSALDSHGVSSYGDEISRLGAVIDSSKEISENKDRPTELNHGPEFSGQSSTDNDPGRVNTGIVIVNHNGIKQIAAGYHSDHSDRSDSDSGIGRNRIEKQMNLKNSDLMTKKSIFTIAFDGVKTDRLRSADSIPPTPYV